MISFLKHVKSYIKHSTDFLNKCGRNTNGNTVIVIFDVVGPYTNISHTFGMEAVRYFLLKYKEDIHPRFNIPFILESIDFILKKTLVSLTMNTFYSLRVLQWRLCLHQRMQTLAWGTMKSNLMI